MTAMTTGWGHHYVSCACLHAQMEDRPELHAACRNQCKYGEEGPEYCECPCHGEAGTQPGRTAPVDQARDAFRLVVRLLEERDIGLAFLSPEFARAVENDPAFFWVHGERPPGEWRGDTQDGP